jgi:AraC-like DNA-binding protein
MYGLSCIKLIQIYFERFEFIFVKNIKLGCVEFDYDENKTNEKFIEEKLIFLGFKVLEDYDLIVVEKIKTAAIELIYLSNNVNSLIRNSDYISQRLGMTYDKITRVFSKVTGTTLEKYIILLKIEKIKELVVNNEFTLSEIAYMLDYSSVQYLSNQFKKITGITVSEFKDNPIDRIPVEKLL